MPPTVKIVRLSAEFVNRRNKKRCHGAYSTTFTLCEISIKYAFLLLASWKPEKLSFAMLGLVGANSYALLLRTAGGNVNKKTP
jgi:prepilin signal peptidase PulO-like enzyme (type II secretory pathway)